MVILCHLVLVILNSPCSFLLLLTLILICLVLVAHLVHQVVVLAPALLVQAVQVPVAHLVHQAAVQVHHRAAQVHRQAVPAQAGIITFRKWSILES